MKTICFFSGDITRPGGTERASTMIANALVEVRKDRILFLSLVEQSNKLFFPLDKRIQHFALGKRWINPGPGYLKVILGLRKFLKQQKIDIIIDIDIVLDSLSIPAAYGMGIKIISWEHFNYNYEMKSLYRHYILKYSVKRTDYVITLTEKDKRSYQQKLNRKKKIAAIYNPVGEVYNKNIIKREKWLLTIGQLIKRKGMDYLIEVAASVLKQHRDWKWIIVGDGEERPLLEQAIKREHLQKQLILEGQKKEINFYLERAQIYVMTSRMEGLPICLLEAKAFRMPIVSFDIPTGPNEIIENGKNGYLIHAFDCKSMIRKLEELIENDELRSCFSKNAWNDLKKFQMQNILEHWNRVLEQL